MRLTTSALGTALLTTLLAGVASAEPNADVPVAGGDAPASASPASGQDLLGDMVVVAGAARQLPKLGVVPSLSADIEDVTLRGVVRRDLDLSGEVEVLSEDAAPPGLYLADSPVDTKAWAKKGAEAVLRVTAKKTGDQVELIGQAFLVDHGDTPVFEKTLAVTGDGVRLGAHRLADALIGALTGHDGGFASRLTFAAGQGNLRRIHVIDADGHGARAVSKDDETPVSGAFGKDGGLYYASSKDNGLYRILSEGGEERPLSTKGSVYGLAFSKDRSKVAVSIGAGPFIRLFAGPDLDHMTQASSAPFAMEPTFTPGGKLAFVGLGTTGQRIFVDDRPVTPDGIFAMSPTFCNHPDGIRLVFAAGPGTHTDLFATGETGGPIARLTQDQGKNSSPACSPDGRLVAFFSTRTAGEGPGLYIMRLDGLRPKRISPLLGDSLRWDRLSK